MERPKVKEHKDLARDPSSGAIVNTNRKAYEQAIAAHKRAAAQTARIDELQSQVNAIDDKLSTIINLLSKGI